MRELLAEIVAANPGLVIAVSGGVDSMTLASFAHRVGTHVRMAHAVSPAVPPLATARVRELAAAENWDLTVIGSGEFDDPRYRDNPSDRCYFCKTNLYDRIRSDFGATPVAAGTNLDDLGDFRPGLAAARERDVIHPFVSAGMDKAAVRALARRLRLADIAELPAQPCLASRVETGIAIKADDLAFIDRVEIALRERCAPATAVRCRITRAGVVVELSDDAVVEDPGQLGTLIATLCASENRRFAGLRPYRRGAMFVR